MKTHKILQVFVLCFCLPSLEAANSPEGFVIGWGLNALYGCNGVSSPESSPVVVTIVGKVLTNAVAFTAGSPRFALLSNGTVFGWGNNDNGQALGYNSGIDTTNGLVRIDGNMLSNVIAISANGIVLKNDGTLLAWGSINKNREVPPSGLSNIVAINGNLALKNDGTVIAWGNNNHGEKTTVPEGLSNVVAVASGLENLALRKDGTVLEWYGNSHLDHKVPDGLSNVIAIANGWTHHLALRSDGTVFGWGADNARGEVTGVPTFTGFVSGPVVIGGQLLSNIVSIAAGDGFSLALKENGKIVAWGNDQWHQTDIPAGLSNVVAIAAGNSFCLAITTNRAVAEKFMQK
jgi:alpha-tubulin suppressor-like RCC1 family protein